MSEEKDIKLTKLEAQGRALEAIIVNHHEYLHGTKDVTQCNEVKESVVYQIKDLKDTLNLIKEKMIKSNSDSIEELEKKIGNVQDNDLHSMVTECWEDIKKLEKDINHHKEWLPANSESLSDIWKEIKELKEKQIHWATLENVTVCRHGIENLEEVLRVIVNDYYEDVFRESMLDKLGKKEQPPRFRNVRKDFPHWFNKDGSLIENPSEQEPTIEFYEGSVEKEMEEHDKKEDEFAEHVGRIIGKENSDDYILVETADLERYFNVWLELLNRLDANEGTDKNDWDNYNKSAKKYLPEDKS